MSIREFFRYYFVRKKSPLSYIWWGNILKRDLGSEGMYNIAIAGVKPDCAINLSSGSPKENNIRICIYDKNSKYIDEVSIQLSYRSMLKIKDGFHKAFRISSSIIKSENRKYEKN